MKHLFCAFILIQILNFETKAQVEKKDSLKIYTSVDGWSFPSKGTYKILNIFIDIIYDQTPQREPHCGHLSIWKPSNQKNINANPPEYLLSFLDTAFVHQDSLKGNVSRLFYESSFGKFIIIGDFISVAVPQSELTKEKAGANFSWSVLLQRAFEIINENGGVNTIYGHNSFSDYDIIKDDKIYFLQVFFRNTVVNENYNYGSYSSSGQGHSGGLSNSFKLIFDGEEKLVNLCSVQAIGCADFTKTLSNVVTHEFSHNLFGPNSSHWGGGHHYGGSQTGTFLGLQGGYGLMGGARSSLICCNGYERWRLAWLNAEYNPELFPIAAGSVSSDISIDSGNCSFILRDFITTGDAIRIKLPYTDAGAHSQYIWLENHQIGYNNKLDFLKYSNTHACRPAGTAGIYAYYQIGKDSLYSKNREHICPSLEADNLKFVSAEGNWDMEYLENEEFFCVQWPRIGHCEKMMEENVFCGVNDLNSHFFNDSTDELSTKHEHFLAIKYSETGYRYANLPHLGDEFDAFVSGDSIDLSTNPAPVTILTYYMRKGKNDEILENTTYLNNRKIYLCGLSINFFEIGENTFAVNIKWDDYKLEKNVRWTGEIVLTENLEITNSTCLILNQNKTPIQKTRDKKSKEFSPVTTFTCLSGSYLHLKPNSQIILSEKSKLIFEEGAKLTIEDGAEIFVEKGCLIIDKTTDKITKSFNKKIKYEREINSSKQSSAK